MEDTQEEIRRIIRRLKAKLTRYAPEPGKIPTAIEGLYLYRRHEDQQHDCFNDPCIGILVQGNKRAIVADEEYRFSEGWYIAYGMDLPAVSHISAVSAEKPYLALYIPFDRYIMSQLAAGQTAGQSAGNERKPLAEDRTYKGITAAKAGAGLLEAFLRLVNLLDTPERIPVLAPMIIREIHYCLLTSPEGDDFRHLGTAKNPNNQIAQAAAWLRSNYREAFNLTKLAGMVNMSQSSFCRHFSRITGMSPLQFQKRLRLYEARRLLLIGTTAETAAYEVGYESPSQFNREYKRQFGEPPHRDRERLRTGGVTAGEETG
jgi:AraC-like DNA-binding protein